MSTSAQHRHSILLSLDALIGFAAFILGTLLYAYLWFCYQTSRVLSTREAEQALAASCDAGIPSAFVFWHDEFLLISLAAFWPRVPMPTIVMGAQFGGRVAARFAELRGTGVEMIHSRRDSRKQRLAQLTTALRDKKWIGIAADYGAPWFAARPTSLQLAHASDGLVVPMHVESSRNLRLGHRGWSVVIPLPFSRVTVKSCTPIRPTSAHANPNAKLHGEGSSLLSQLLNTLRKDRRPPMPSYARIAVTE